MSETLRLSLIDQARANMREKERLQAEANQVRELLGATYQRCLSLFEAYPHGAVSTSWGKYILKAVGDPGEERMTVVLQREVRQDITDKITISVDHLPHWLVLEARTSSIDCKLGISADSKHPQHTRFPTLDEAKGYSCVVDNVEAALYLDNPTPRFVQAS